MDDLIRQHLGERQTSGVREEFSQNTLGQLIQTLENMAAEGRDPIRVVYGWRDALYPDLPLLPVNRQLPSSSYQDLSAHLGQDATTLLYLFDDGASAFSLLGQLVDNPEISVFQQRLPVRALWSFDRTFQQELLAELERRLPFHRLPLDDQPRRNGLAARFHGRLIKFLEESLLETRQSLNLITGILRVQKTISRELDFERLLELIGDTLIETFHFQLGELELYDAEESRLVHQVTWNMDSPGQTLSRNLQILLDVEQERSLFLAGAPVVLEALRRHPLVLNHRLVEILGLRFAILLPLFAGDEKVGLLKLYYGHPEVISPTRLAWLEELSNLMASAILNAREHTRVFELATKDGLTSLHNRRYFEEQFNLELARTRRTGARLSLLMLDVDHFKTYNDRNGHLAGDEVLVQVARLVKQNIRSVDLIARYGGEEFIILLTGADILVGRTVAEKIRAAIADHPFPHGGGQPGGRLTVSIGVAEMKSSTRALEEMIRRADAALYRAKEQGRNRVQTDG
ncbi:MAG: sensor domain-containing diguanylate cyclase [bacterium]|jgi:diguanylate cyclase (GGDEF)-like protein|nr:sensor domain-containing diguanylate cyclase [bacterium]